MNNTTSSPQVCSDWRTRPVDSTVYSQYDHLERPVKVGDLVMAKGKDGPIVCQVERLMADGVYVKTIGVQSRLSSLLRPSSIWNVANEG